MENNKSNTRDRELIVTKTFDAPIDLVWEAWTEPGHVCNWWGPDGFTCTISKMELQPGGEWLLVLHGPDGRNYDNKSIFTEIVPFQKIAYEHLSYPHFLTTVTFEAQGGKTCLHWHMLFDTAEDFINVVRTFGADKGLKENILKLNTYLEQIKN